MNKWFFTLCAVLNIVGCVEMDGSTLIVDDNGVTHRTQHYLRDTRGKNYYPKEIPALGHKLFVFDPKAYAWAAYDANGDRVMTGAASGGKEYCEDIGKPCRTATGDFHIYNKRGLDCRSGEYPVETKGGTKMPYCMYFYRGFTIHAGYEVPYANMSHGCIRVWPSAAKWLNEEFMTIGTEVKVLSYPNEDGDGAPI